MSVLLLVVSTSSTRRTSDMTHKEESSAVRDALEVLVESGLEGMAEAMQILFNEAMKAERSAFLRAEPYQRTTDCRGHANGFKPKAVRSRVGDLELRIPQVRAAEEPFYPQSLERSLRSELALKLAVAEMYLQGVSTRRSRSSPRSTAGCR